MSYISDGGTYPAIHCADIVTSFKNTVAAEDVSFDIAERFQILHRISQSPLTKDGLTPLAAKEWALYG